MIQKESNTHKNLILRNWVTWGYTIKPISKGTIVVISLISEALGMWLWVPRCIWSIVSFPRGLFCITTSGLRGSCPVTCCFVSRRLWKKWYKHRFLIYPPLQKNSHGVTNFFMVCDYFSITLIVSALQFSVNTYVFVFPQQQ